MKIYFGQVSTEDLSEFGTEGLLENNGNYYSASVEFGSNPGGLEDVTISDGCGRYIPISVEDLVGLCTALCEVANISKEIKHAEELLEYVESKHNTAEVCKAGHIHY